MGIDIDKKMGDIRRVDCPAVSKMRRHEDWMDLVLAHSRPYRELQQKMIGEKIAWRYRAE